MTDRALLRCGGRLLQVPAQLLEQSLVLPILCIRNNNNYAFESGNVTRHAPVCAAKLCMVYIQALPSFVYPIGQP